MKLSSLLVATMLLSGSLAMAQVCPPSTSNTSCLVPSNTVTYQPGVLTASATTTCPPTATTVVPGCMVGTVPAGGTCGNVSPDTACILNELRANRATLMLAGLEMRGTMLTNRTDRLISDETIFRTRLAANPTWPDAQVTSMQISNEATLLNRDIIAYNRELSMIPADQRPYIASSLNTYDTLYWEPTLAELSNYQTSFAQNVTVYQPAYACNTWLQGWVTNYQTTVVSLGQTPQTFASARWWSTTQVLGSTEFYPGQPAAGSTMVLPSGSAIFIPASSNSAMICPPGTVPANGYMGTTPTYQGTNPTMTAPSNLGTAPPTTNEPTGTNLTPNY